MATGEVLGMDYAITTGEGAGWPAMNHIRNRGTFVDFVEPLP